MHKCCVKFLFLRSGTLLKQTFSDVPKRAIWFASKPWIGPGSEKGIYIMHKCYVKFLFSRSGTLLKQTFSDVPKHVLFGSLLNLGSWFGKGYIHHAQVLCLILVLKVRNFVETNLFRCTKTCAIWFASKPWIGPGSEKGIYIMHKCYV